jgi:hypothetical protein
VTSSVSVRTHPRRYLGVWLSALVGPVVVVGLLRCVRRFVARSSPRILPDGREQFRKKAKERINEVRACAVCCASAVAPKLDPAEAVRAGVCRLEPEDHLMGSDRSEVDLPHGGATVGAGHEPFGLRWPRHVVRCQRVLAQSAAHGTSHARNGSPRVHVVGVPCLLLELRRSSSRIRYVPVIHLAAWVSVLVGAWAAVGLARFPRRLFSRSAPISLPLHAVRVRPLDGAGFPVAQVPPDQAAPGRSRWSATLAERPGPAGRPGCLWCVTGEPTTELPGAPGSRASSPGRRRRCSRTPVFSSG